jgi:hydroxymethylpyrimidine/phosphomethylpyrimidine kinase
MAAMTALTAQNTKGVTGVHELPPDFVAQQVETVFDDIRVDAVKIGMAGSGRTITQLGDVLQKRKPKILVLDPVMVAQSGDALLSDEAVKRLKIALLPLASIVTPNIPEAEILLGKKIRRRHGIFREADFETRCARAVLLKGGHLKGETAKDVFADANQMITLEEKRVKTKHNHGTGCTLSSALAVYMAKGLPVEEAARAAKRYVTGALQKAEKLKVGKGAGPLHHFYALWK